jgi:capsular exopolysaccharide synthesis family protein
MATGQMMVQPRVQSTVGNVVGEEASNFYGTQVNLMQGVEVQSKAHGTLKEYIKTLGVEPSASLSVSQRKNSSLFDLSVVSTHPEFAKRYLDAVMSEFIAYRKKLRKGPSDDYAESLLKQLNELDASYKQAEGERLAFEEKNKMQVFVGQGNDAAQYLIDLRRKLAEVKTELTLLNTETAEQTIERTTSKLAGGHSSTTSASTNDVFQIIPSPKNVKFLSEGPTYRRNILLLNAEREDLSRFLKPKHPKIVRISEEIERNERLLKLALEQDSTQIAAYRDSLTKQEESFEKNIQQWEKLASEANTKIVEHNRLKSNEARTKELYDTVRKQFDTIEVGKPLDQEMIAVSAIAEVLQKPIGPNRTKDLLTSGMIGLIIAIAIIVLLERFDDRVKTVEDLQDMIEETVLGQVPMVPSRNSGSGPLLLSDLPAHNAFSEAFRNVRSSLMFSPLGGPARTIGVTSAIPGDGKTTCSVNLAICLAQVEGGRTLIIDGDMRKMNVHEYFGMQNMVGLAELLSGQATLDQCLYQTGIPNLDILTAGAYPPSPGELILSERFTSLLEQLKQSYNRIIIDTPPVLATDDTLSMAHAIDGLIFIVKANQTSMRFVTGSMNSIRQRGGKIFGLVLNQIDTSAAHHYYYYYYSSYYHHNKGGPPTGRSMKPASSAFQPAPKVA